MDRREQGQITVWLLGLAVMLVFLGGVSLDLWRAFGARQALADAVDAAAIAGASGIDEAAFRASGAVVLDPDRAQALALDTFASQDVGSLLVPSPPQPQIAVSPDLQEVTVVADGEVDLTLLRILMPTDEPLHIRVTAVASPEEAP